jgi:hypothetical protein
MLLLHTAAVCLPTLHIGVWLVSFPFTPCKEVCMRGFRVAAILGLALLPAAAFAQSSLAGVAKDTSGAVLPGVTVEASSPALIEKVRSVTTDASGQYKIVDLRPGTYSLSFSLPGFSVVKREGIELGGSGTVQINADLKVGALEETITVSGETPVVDVQNAARTQNMSGELVANTPAAKSWNGIMLLVPGVTGDTNTLQLQPTMILFGIHGGPATEGRLQVDGMNVGASRGGGGVSGYSVDTANVQEVTFRTSGGMGEAETGGPYMNFVPKTGGNQFKGTAAFQASGSGLQSDNYTDYLRSVLSKPSTLLALYDVDGALGGPIKKDKLWFFYLGRTWGSSTSVTGMFANRNAGNPNAWTFDPDPAVQARNDNSTIVNSLRLTWQINQKNKLNVFADYQKDATARRGSEPPRRPAARIPTAGLKAAPRQSRLKRPFTATRHRSASGRRRGRTRSTAGCCSTSATARTTAAGAGRSRRATRRPTSFRCANKAGASRGSAIARSARCAAPAS